MKLRLLRVEFPSRPRALPGRAGLVGLVSLALWGGFAGNCAARSPNPFTIVVLPDTQHYSDNLSNYYHFVEQVKWIEANREARNIVFVTHVGDLVQNNGPAVDEWTRADRAMRRLDAVPELPYSVVVGNHDYDRSASDPNDSADTFIGYFGAQRFARRPWYGGASPNGRSQWQRFFAGGRTFLHLALEWRPLSASNANAAEVGAWAQSVLDAHPKIPTVITTHEYLGSAGRKAAGNDLFNSLINENPQIFMVLCGHELGEHHQVVANAARGRVYEILANFQGLPEGGTGYLLLLEFDEPSNSITASTYSPSLDLLKPGELSQYSLGVPFAGLLGPGGESMPIWWSAPQVVELDREEAEVTATINQDAAVVKLVWDSVDRGASALTDWANVSDLGSWGGGLGEIKVPLVGLAAGTSCSYRFFASHGLTATESWSRAGTFTTLSRGGVAFGKFMAGFGFTEAESLSGADPDHDSLSNLEEFSYGLNPSVSDHGAVGLGVAGKMFSPGSPVAYLEPKPLRAGLRFVRRTDHAVVGLRYAVQVSSDLVTWEDRAATPTVVQQDSVTGYEVVEVEFPIKAGRAAQYYRTVIVLE